MFDRVVILVLCYSALFLSGLETEMAEYEAGISLMDETLNMVIFADDNYCAIINKCAGTEKTFRNYGKLL